MLTVCAAVVLAAGLAAVWVRVVRTLTESPSGPTTVGQPGALVWDERVFTSSAQLKAYLTAHGLSYSRWAARHPTAFGASAPTVTPHTTKHTSTKHAAKHPTPTTAKPKPKPKPTPTHVAAPAITATRSRSFQSLLLTTLLLIGGLGLAASAVIPPRYAPLPVARFYADPGRRTVALAAATAVLLGFGVSFYMT